MTTNELEIGLKNITQNIIRALGYVQSGALINSISYNVSNINGDLKIKMNSVEYIQYVGNGKIIDAIGNSIEIANLIAKFEVDYIESLFKKR